jgi:hypothetical protein
MKTTTTTTLCFLFTLLAAAGAFTTSPLLPASNLYSMRSANSQSTARSSSSPSSSSRLFAGKDDLIAIAEKANPVINFYDPLKLADASFWGDTNEATIGFLRHAEIKHSRVAMAAFVGYVAQCSYTFPWSMTLDGLPYPSSILPPEAQWASMVSKKLVGQILLFFKTMNYTQNAHYILNFTFRFSFLSPRLLSGK